VTQGTKYDLLVVGGGINGAGIARDAAGRGLSVLLCEQDDLAAHTSSASTKLIHGGLRYLEYREFGLVRKALQERETLLRAAPHIMWPLRFVMPHMPDLRPAWLIRAGLFLYDHLARRELHPGSRGIVMRDHPAGAPLVESIKRGFVYSDGWVNDARLVVLNALDAAEHGAKILTRTKLLSAVRAGGEWRAQLRRADGTTLDVRAASIANAAGPWVGELLQGALVEVIDKRSPVMLLNDIDDLLVKSVFECEVNAFLYVGNDDERAHRRGEVVVRIALEVHVLGEIIGFHQLADIVEVRTDAAKSGVGADCFGGRLGEVRDHKAMMIGAGRLDGHPAQERMIQVGRFKPGNVGCDLEDLFEERQGAAYKHGSHDAVADGECALDTDHRPIGRGGIEEVERTD